MPAHSRAHPLPVGRGRSRRLADASQLFAQQFIDESLPVIHCHMKSVLVQGAQQLTYLYQWVREGGPAAANRRLAPSPSLSSNAAECALHNGIAERVVARGRDVSCV